jgi:HAD superfamily hydrolase (TIGR01450 family)
VVFVTNNATRTPAQAADKIERLTGVTCHPGDLVTSPQAAARLLRPQDLPVFVVGEEGITGVLAEAGLATTTRSEEAGSVMVGMTPAVTYQWIADAADAVRRGARFLATNIDPTYPTATGLKPGAGSIVAAISVASGVEPEVAGKPLAPMRELIRERVDGPAWVVGDRIDTDVALADAEPDWSSILVLSGATGTGTSGIDADHVVADFPTAVDLILEVGEGGDGPP